MWLCKENMSQAFNVSDKTMTKVISIIEENYDTEDLPFEDICEIFDDVLFEYNL